MEHQLCYNLKIRVNNSFFDERKIRKCKNELRKLYKEELKEIDFDGDSISPYADLNKVSIISKIDEELTDIIYDILDNKNS